MQSMCQPYFVWREGLKGKVGPVGRALLTTCCGINTLGGRYGTAMCCSSIAPNNVAPIQVRRPCSARWDGEIQSLSALWKVRLGRASFLLPKYWD